MQVSGQGELDCYELYELNILLSNLSQATNSYSI